ncbi:MAG: histidine phosphatase family protein [Sneathiellales bacterium]|nr:histidine phosphatase family protein [Sneathiellales bacterium]
MTATLYFVRHGEAAGSWDQSKDPGLSDLGKEQARQAALELQQFTSPVELYSSPLRRARETAVPLEETWRLKADIKSEITEIPSNDIPFDQRRSWLSKVMGGKWEDQSDVLNVWRQNILDIARRRETDCIFFCHFMVINAIVGAVEGQSDTVIFKPDNGSITRILADKGQLSLIERGREAITVIR